jgi:hypothetical protein
MLNRPCRWFAFPRPVVSFFAALDTCNLNNINNIRLPRSLMIWKQYWSPNNLIKEYWQCALSGGNVAIVRSFKLSAAV